MRTLLKTLPLTLIILTGITESFSKITSDLEPIYTEAVIAFNAKQFDQALKTLEAPIRTNPEVPEFLELKSLCLKALNRSSEAETLYQQLIELKTKSKAPANAVAPYHFELGILRLKKDNLEDARRRFKTTLAANYNTDASAFFLGLIEHKSKRFPESEAAFLRVTRGDDLRLSAPAHYYLGQIHIQTGYSAGAADEWVQSRDAALRLLKDENLADSEKKAAQEIATQAAKALAPFDRFGFFGNATLLTAYDSNVLALPDSTADTAATNRSSFKVMFQGGGGIMTSPLRLAQATASYRTSFNLNLNAAAYAGQFWSHIGSLYLTARPLSRFRFGIRGEGTLTLQSQKETSTANAMFRPFSAGATGAGFVQWEFARRWLGQTEVSFTPQYFYLDPSSAAGDRRSGLTWGVRTSVTLDRRDRWLNPMMDLHYSNQGTSGTEYDVQSYGLLLGNTFYLAERLRVGSSASVDYSSFPSRASGVRTDWLLSAGLNPSFRLVGALSVQGEFRYTRNASSVMTLYGYDRWIGSVGLSYAL